MIVKTTFISSIVFTALWFVSPAHANNATWWPQAKTYTEIMKAVSPTESAITKNDWGLLLAGGYSYPSTKAIETRIFFTPKVKSQNWASQWMKTPKMLEPMEKISSLDITKLAAQIERRRKIGVIASPPPPVFKLVIPSYTIGSNIKKPSK